MSGQLHKSLKVLAESHQLLHKTINSWTSPFTVESRERRRPFGWIWRPTGRAFGVDRSACRPACRQYLSAPALISFASALSASSGAYATRCAMRGKPQFFTWAVGLAPSQLHRRVELLPGDSCAAAAMRGGRPPASPGPASPRDPHRVHTGKAIRPIAIGRHGRWTGWRRTAQQRAAHQADRYQGAKRVDHHLLPALSRAAPGGGRPGSRANRGPKCRTRRHRPRPSPLPVDKRPTGDDEQAQARAEKRPENQDQQPGELQRI